MTRLLAAFALLITINCNAQNQAISIPTSTVDLKTNYSTEWVTYVDNQDFSIEYKFIDCDPEMGYDFETAVLRFKNKTNQKLEFSWHIDIYRGEVCKTCAYEFEYSRTIVLGSNEVIEGDCVRNSNNQLKVFSKFIDANYTKGERLTMFQLNNLTVIQY